MNRRPFPTLSLMLFLAVMGNHARGDEPGSAVEKRTPGLIGLAHKNGDPTRIAYHYPHGKVFPADLIRSRFHDGDTESPSVEISLTERPCHESSRRCSRACSSVLDEPGQVQRPPAVPASGIGKS